MTAAPGEGRRFGGRRGVERVPPEPSPKVDRSSYGFRRRAMKSRQRIVGWSCRPCALGVGREASADRLGEVIGRLGSGRGRRTAPIVAHRPGRPWPHGPSRRRSPGEATRDGAPRALRRTARRSATGPWAACTAAGRDASRVAGPGPAEFVCSMGVVSWSTGRPSRSASTLPGRRDEPMGACTAARGRRRHARLRRGLGATSPWGPAPPPGDAVSAARPPRRSPRSGFFAPISSPGDEIAPKKPVRARRLGRC